MGELSEYWHDVKAHKKSEKDQAQQHETSQGVVPAVEVDSSRCWDWMLVSGNTHYARDRAAFTTYKPVTGTVGGVEVAGIGTVRLQAVTGPEADAPIGTLELVNVLHIPTAIANGFCAMRWGGSASFGKLVKGRDNAGNPAYIAVGFCGLSRLVLAGDPQGVSLLQDLKDGSRALMLSIYMTDE